MNEVESIQLQLERIALTLSYNIQDIYWSLDELKNITEILFDITPHNDEAINTWLEQEQFVEDEQGYYKSLNLINKYHDKSLSADAIAFQWPALVKNSSALKFRFYALRNLGKHLQRIKEKLGNVTTLYYQDFTNNACLTFPYFDTNIIPADFNWQEYHACLSINPKNNPDKKIQWTPANIGYAGEGLISIASIPVYKDKTFIGAWSIDVPLQAIHKNTILDTYVPKQINFITVRILSMTLTTVTSKGQVTIPKNIRELLHLYAGDQIEFIFNETDEVILRPVTKKVADVCGGLAKYQLSKPVSVYHVKRNDLIKAVSELMLMPILDFEKQTAVRDFITSSKNSTFDLSDILIAQSAKISDCATTLTFDKKA